MLQCMPLLRHWFAVDAAANVDVADATFEFVESASELPSLTDVVDAPIAAAPPPAPRGSPQREPP